VSSPTVLLTDRLRLVPGTDELAMAAVNDREELARLLGAAVPAEWPPRILDNVQLYFAGTLALFPEQAGWWVWYIVLRGGPGEAGAVDRLIGSTGFKGEPTPDGEVETGYSMLDGFWNRGYATEAVAALVGWAFRDDRVRRVAAEAYPDNPASFRVMEKCGFTRFGPGWEQGTIRYHLARSGPSASMAGRVGSG
jgi:ribosomal-protein-alanine N-acetyltransferase